MGLSSGGTLGFEGDLIPRVTKQYRETIAAFNEFPAESAEAQDTRRKPGSKIKPPMSTSAEAGIGG
jgi:hypothetical protein